jgi:hypothetical protein
MILILLSAFLIQNTTLAQIGPQNDDSPAIQAAIDLRNEFIKALESKDFTSFAHKGMDAAIHKLAEQIVTEHQDTALATELLTQWESSSKIFNPGLMSSMMDIGDHSPLFPWIDAFLDKMAAKYGSIVYSLPLVKDIQMMNYALPVVFSPHGAWQSDAASEGIDLRIEYRKHFIPFANLVTYYVTLLGCEYVAQRQGQPELKKVCKPVAKKLEFAMGRYVAPVVSDWIYSASTQNINIGSGQIRYNTVDELRRAIQH